jgi:uncharacterized membrane protein YoaK (UPF0700 family)
MAPTNASDHVGLRHRCADSRPSRSHIPHLCQLLPSPNLVFPLVVLTFATGTLDSTTYATFGTFTSNQTGNVVIISVGLADAARVNLRNSGISLASYLVTGFLGGQIGAIVGHRRRWWLLVSSTVQALCLMVLSILVFADIVASDNDSESWVLITLLGATAGFQVAVARNVNVGEMPTAMLSSPM